MDKNIAFELYKGSYYVKPENENFVVRANREKLKELSNIVALANKP